MKRLADLRTPALVLDLSVLRRNCSVMTERMRGHGVALRPHMKTAKSPRVAEIATQGNFGGIAVSTVAEAIQFAMHGYRDITYAVGIVPTKLDGLVAAQEKGARISLVTDNFEMARGVSERARALGRRFPILIEIDSGQHRAGLAPDSPILVDLAGAIHNSPALELAGVLTHAGHAYHCRGREALEAAAEGERAAVVAAAERLRAAGLPCPTVSAGSTPTAVHAQDLAGVTEMRPGVYMFCDLDQYGIGACGLEDIAVTVLASVIGHAPERNTLLVDAGALALSKDTLAGEFLPDAGYGWVCDPDSGRRIGDLRVNSVDQEHGRVAGEAPVPYERVPLGGRVRILPSHACMTAAAYSHYHVVDSASAKPDLIIDTWPRIGGW